MATQEMAEINSRFAYLRRMKVRYQAADRQEKGRLLTEMQDVTGLHRKYLISVMNAPAPYRHKRNRERTREYGADVERAVLLIAETLDWICAERLKPALPPLAQHLAKFGELAVSPELLGRLESISVCTLRRMIQRVHLSPPDLPRARRGRHADTVAQARVPVSVIPWHEPEPGHFEMDLVHHSRAGGEGPFACTAQFVDVLTGWSERFAILGYNFDTMWRLLETFHQHCPIPVRELHADNGPEFINQALVTYLSARLCDIRLTRGSPGQKNHNRFVEQKNCSLVRVYVSDLYLHTPEQVALLNIIYADMWRYYNFFQPVLRQTGRHVALLTNGICRIRREQDTARTPFERLLRARPPISQATRQQLQDLYDHTNPRQLRERIHAQLKELYRLAASEERSMAAQPR